MKKGKLQPSLYQEILANGITVDSHESDLYVPDTLLAREIIKKHKHSFTVFTSQIDGKQWLDIPFAYGPFWDKVHKRNS